MLTSWISTLTMFVGLSGSVDTGQESMSQNGLLSKTWDASQVSLLPAEVIERIFVLDQLDLSSPVERLKRALSLQCVSKHYQTLFSVENVVSSCFTADEITQLLIGTFRKIPLAVGLTLIKHGGNIHAPQDTDGNCLLHQMATRNDIESAKKLIDLGANRNVANIYGQTPFMFTHVSQKYFRQLLLTGTLPTHQSVAYVAPLANDGNEPYV